jgi:hypothetical protein
MSFVYWIHDENCHHPSHHGYVGVSENPWGRLCGLRTAGIVPVDSKLKLLFEGTREKCLKVERKYRPKRHIGWNTEPGGKAAEPRIRGRRRIRPRYVRHGRYYDCGLKPVKRKVSVDKIHLFFCYASADRLRFARFCERIEAGRS